MSSSQKGATAKRSTTFAGAFTNATLRGAVASLRLYSIVNSIWQTSPMRFNVAVRVKKKHDVTRIANTKINKK
jgi:hypothetical protein